MKKILLLIFAVTILSPLSFAQWGLGVKLGAGENDPKDMEDAFDSMYGVDRTLTTSPGIFALEVLYEKNIESWPQYSKLGIKAGFDIYGQNNLDISGYGDALTETTYSLPITVYYKYDPGVKKLSFYGGAGITILRTNFKIDNYIASLIGLNDEYNGTKVFPHISAGSEYRFSNLFALGLDIKYNIAAKVTENTSLGSLILSDRSGLSGALAARFYF